MRLISGMLLGAALMLGCSGTSTDSDAGGATPDAGRACEQLGVDASLSCVKPCDEGNERRVGEFCTFGGGECDDNTSVSGGAIICTVDYGDESGHTFCSRPCEQDTQCGTGAVCRGDPASDGGQKGCVPSSCL